MDISQEKQYLRELKLTHEMQVFRGKVTSAKNTLILINDCEKRIENLSKFNVKILSEEKVNNSLREFIKKKIDPNLLTENSVLIKDFDFDYILYSDGKLLRCENIQINRLGHEYNKKDKFILSSLVCNTAQVGVIINGKTVRKQLAKLVYENFKRQIPKGFYINHLDGDVMNCNINNLGLKMRDKINTKKRKSKVA